MEWPLRASLQELQPCYTLPGLSRTKSIWLYVPQSCQCFFQAYKPSTVGLSSAASSGWNLNALDPSFLGFCADVRETLPLMVVLAQNCFSGVLV